MPMPMPRPTDEAIGRFRRAIEGRPEVETRKMFGLPCAFARGQMFLHLWGDDLVLRLPEADRAAFVAASGATPFAPTPGRGMREYSVIPAALARDTDALAPWLARSLAYVTSLPPKPPKVRKAKRA